MEPYVPEKLPIGSINWDNLFERANLATAMLSKYDGMLIGINNPEILLSPMTTQEAVLSSKIEGTQATLEDVLRFEADPAATIADEKRDDIVEIINYRKAMFHAVKAMEEKPVNLNMIKEMHGILLKSVRGKDKRPGNFRKDQNHIGPPGSTMANATYVPPIPLILDECLNNFINYFHAEERNKIVQTAILHAQFEIIHPFSDGNGRVGRLLIPLFLYGNKLIKSPVFYISAFFDRNRDEYYYRLKSISESKDWMGWIEFFLTAIIEQAKENMDKINNILQLREKIKNSMESYKTGKYAIKTLDTIFKMPLFTNPEFANTSGIPPASVARIISELTKNGVIHEIRKGAGRRPKLNAFEELLLIIG